MIFGSNQKLLMARAGVPAGGGIAFVGYNDTNLQGSYTLDYPTGTQSGDLLFLFCGNDGSVSAGTPSGWTKLVEGEAPIDVFYRTAGAESSVIAPAGTDPSIGGAIVVSFRNAAYVQSNTLNLGTGHTPPTSFTAFSGATVGNSCVCFVWYDDDIQSGDATQTDFSVAVSDFYGSGAGAGCSMNVTYAFDVVDSTTFTPPDLNASGIVSEGYRSWAFEIEPTVTPAAPSWTDPDLANASYDSVSFSVAGQETNPNGIAFNDTGDKLFIIGNASDQVREYSLSTAWDVGSASYSQGYSVSSQDTNPLGLTFKPDGTKMYVTGNTGDSVYEYSLSSAWDVSSASYVQSFSVATEDTSPRGIYFKSDGSKMFVVGNSGDDLLEYALSASWDISSASYTQNFSVSAQETDPIGLFMSPDGLSFFIIGRTNDTVYQYDMSSAWDISTASYSSDSASVASQEDAPCGVFFKSDGSKMYIVGLTNDTIYQYSTVTPAAPSWTDPDLANASYDSVSFSVAGQETSPRGLFFKPDGSKVYVVGATGDDVNEYNLSTAWDVSTAAYLQNFSVATQETFPKGLSFKSDGSKMYIVGDSGHDVIQYDLSTAWDISTASYVQAFDISSQTLGPNDLFFKPDGTKFYVIEYSSDTIDEYDLGTAWDISTASYSQNFSVASQETVPSGIFIGATGVNLFIIGETGDDVSEYLLSTAWDISTASYVQNFSVASQDTSPQSLAFKSDGSKLYVLGEASQSIYQYST